MAAEDSDRFVRAGAGSVDRPMLDQLQVAVDQQATDFLVRPPYAMFPSLARLRRDVFGLLDARQRPALLPELYGVAGRLTVLLAHACADLGQPGYADAHARTAWMCADLAGDATLKVYIRWVQSNAAYWAGDYMTAAELAHDGLPYAIAGTSRLRLLSQEARALAACHEHSNVTAVLGEALAERDRQPEDELPGVFAFSPGKAAYYASEVHAALGGTDNLRLAASDALESIELFDQHPDRHAPEFVAAARLDLGNAHLALGDIDAAALQLRTVMTLSSDSRTQPIISRMNTARTNLRKPHLADARQTSDLSEEISLFLAYPATQEPPALPS